VANWSGLTTSVIKTQLVLLGVKVLLLSSVMINDAASAICNDQLVLDSDFNEK
jgi:hypothetical protein